MRREFPVGPHDDGRPSGGTLVHHRRDPQARGFPPGTLSWGSFRDPMVRYLTLLDLTYGGSPKGLQIQESLT